MLLMFGISMDLTIGMIFCMYRCELLGTGMISDTGQVEIFQFPHLYVTILPISPVCRRKLGRPGSDVCCLAKLMVVKFHDSNTFQ